MPNVYPAKANRTVSVRVAHPADGRMTVRSGVITGGIPATATVTAASRSGNTVVLTVNNSLAAGRRVLVDLSDGSYDGIFVLTGATGTTVTYTQNAADAGTTTGTMQDLDTCNIRVKHSGETYSSVIRRLGDRGTNNTNWNTKWML